MSAELVKALMVTAEVTGTDLSEGAATVIAEELASYETAQVMSALRKCRRELKGRMTLAAVIDRLDDGRPGPDEAFSMLPRDEAQTVVWTDEIARAAPVAYALLEAGDKVGARMAFRERYMSLVAEARAARKPVNWMVSLGHDPRGREGPIREAIDSGRLSVEYVGEFLPAPIEPKALEFASRALKVVR